MVNSKEGQSRASSISSRTGKQDRSGQRAKKHSFCPEEGEFVKNGKRYIRIVTNDLVRDLLVPSQQPNTQSLLFCNNNFSGFEHKYDGQAGLGKAALAKKAKEERRRKLEESSMRKRELTSFNAFTSHGPILEEFEKEASRKANFFMDRARELRKEQEDEIKTCNAYILSKKCQAIRDAQVAEKKVIENELKEENERLEKMMHQELMKTIENEEQVKRNDLEKKEKFKQAILQQIRDNELDREIMAERIEEEQRLINEAAIQVQLDALAETRRKMEEKAKVREEMYRINQEIVRLAEEEKKEAKLAELRVQECIRMKVEEEEKREEELSKKKYEKEKELAKIRANQQQAQDKQALRDEIEAKRIHDEVERKWKKKELEAVEARARKNKELHDQRLRQMEERRKLEAAEAELELMEIARSAEIESSIRKQEEMEKIKMKQELLQYRADLLKQMSEKEEEKIKKRKQLFEDGFLIKMEQKNREDELKKTMMRKMDEIRTHNIPDRYIKELEKKLNLADQEKE